jgi:hypothetical protein
VLAAENMICGPEWETVTGDWKKLHYEKLLDSFSSPDIIRAKQSEMGGKSIGEKKMRARFWWGSPKERDCLEDLRVDRKITLKWVLK